MRSDSSRPTALIFCASSATRSCRQPVLDGTQQREQRRRRRQHHALAERPVDEIAVALGRRGKERVVGDEEHHELGALLDLGGVAARRQALHVRPDLGEVPAQRLIARVLVARLDGVEIGGERHLGVDDDDPLRRQAHDDVGTQPAGLAGDRLLLDEVAERRHAGELGDAAQRDLAPAAADVRRAQRLHQLVGLGAQRLMGDGDVAQLLADLAEVALAPLLDAARFLLVAVERLLQRPDQRLDGEAPRSRDRRTRRRAAS